MPHDHRGATRHAPFDGEACEEVTIYVPNLNKHGGRSSQRAAVVVAYFEAACILKYPCDIVCSKEQSEHVAGYSESYAGTRTSSRLTSLSFSYSPCEYTRHVYTKYATPILLRSSTRPRSRSSADVPVVDESSTVSRCDLYAFGRARESSPIRVEWFRGNVEMGMCSR